MQVPTTFVGVDVAKDELVVAIHGQPGCRTISNGAAAIDAWLHTLPPGSCVAVESTGAHHLLVIKCAIAAGLAAYVLNARDVFFYAKAVGARAKTDQLDSAVIARYLAEHHQQLHPYRLPSEVQAKVDQLLGQRWAVVSKRVSLRQALKGCELHEPLAGLLQALERMLKAIDQRIQELIATDAQLQQTQRLLQTITGVGAQSSALLATLLHRIPFARSDALVAYSGLDPRANDSGKKQGRRMLSKRGSPELRRQMYLVAFAACHSKALGPTYKALRAKGFQTTEAMVILARKLLRAAFAVWKTQTAFDLTKLGLKTA